MHAYKSKCSCPIVSLLVNANNFLILTYMNVPNTTSAWEVLCPYSTNENTFFINEIQAMNYEGSRNISILFENANSCNLSITREFTDRGLSYSLLSNI